MTAYSYMCALSPYSYYGMSRWGLIYESSLVIEAMGTAQAKLDVKLIAASTLCT